MRDVIDRKSLDAGAFGANAAVRDIVVGRSVEYIQPRRRMQLHTSAVSIGHLSTNAGVNPLTHLHLARRNSTTPRPVLEVDDLG